MTTLEKKLIEASWNGQEYTVDPSDADCDCAGESGTDGWWSEDGDNWLDFGGGLPAGDFADVTILLVGGPRDGVMV